MKRLCCILVFAAASGSLSATGTTAIGTFSRRFDSPVSKEIILRFPIFLSKAYTRAKKGRVMYPNEFSRMRDEKKIASRVIYAPEEYAQISKLVEGGNLLTGEIFEYAEKAKDEDGNEIEPTAEVPDKKYVLVKLYHYSASTGKISAFTVYSKPETVVIDLLRTMLPLEKDRYLSRPITSASKLAIMAPLEPVELNDFYISLLSQKFKVHALSGSDFESTTPKDLQYTRHLVTQGVSYFAPMLTVSEMPPPLSAAGDNEANNADYNAFSAIVARKDYGFDRELRGILGRIRGRTGADYLLLLNPDGKNSFARGFDLTTGGMVWYQDSFPAKSSANSEMLASMISEMQRPLVILSEEQINKIAEEKDRMSAQGASGGLASVAILDFYDRTNTPLYTWLASSLSIAIDDSMKKIFEYDRANEKKSFEAGSRIFRSPTDVNEKTLKEFQAATGADYLIFGFYSVSAKTGNIVIESKIFDLAKKKEIGGSTTESPVDVRLFNVVDEISQGIVQDIFSMTQQQTK
ncbi:hypothetical protein [Turneriella parva]|uniref:Lipoprotein n=1 Tax=Turneriella parva (strain ATCC BAA-1111 / DSM 21527 / NCTC 11395 / H) TaxID=869212 RepID=I4B5U3_TURPD|nr:hypothetical protein [Turneriella parva]AFM12650.1 hypothetical protein Turpa_2004 [Turneriella parva DSM 21527]